MKKNIEALLNKYDEAALFSGAILIKENGETIYENAFGYANREWDIENTPETRFRIASVAKMFTAVGVMKLIDYGLLELDSKVVEILDLGASKIPKTVTLYHLLTHTSGLSDYYDESTGYEGWDQFIDENTLHRLSTSEDFLKLFMNKEPENEPGQIHKYNNGGYILLAMVIEKVSELDFSEFINNYIFEPLEMSDTDYSRLDSIQNHTAEGYMKLYDADDQVIGWGKNIYDAIPASGGDGGVTSTVKDLYKFYNGLRQGWVLSKDAYELFTKAHVVDQMDGYKHYDWKYGFAHMFIEKEGEIIRTGHTGEESGVSCRLYHYPRQKVDVVILGNQDGAAGKLGWDLHDIIIDN